jgi:prolyl 4-hydroxylase
MAVEEEIGETDYGVDISFPTHNRVSINYPSLPHNQDPEHNIASPQFQHMPLQILGNRQELYLRHLEGCHKTYQWTDPTQCDLFEWDRMVMNRRQPQSMVNLTETGFKKVRAPVSLTKLVEEFWITNKDEANHKAEQWGAGNSYVNHWEAPTTMISVDDKGLRGSGAKLKEELWAATSAIAEEWTQQELQPCSLYGIRIYHRNATMMPHVDRLPLVVSAMLNVAQETEEDWPLELYDHQGHAHNITLHPGEMLLFESASVIHGHPFPLNGSYYASIFLHFEPTGRTYQKVDGHFFLRDTHHNRQSKSIREVNDRYHQVLE